MVKLYCDTCQAVVACLKQPTDAEIFKRERMHRHDVVEHLHGECPEEYKAVCEDCAPELPVKPIGTFADRNEAERFCQKHNEALSHRARVQDVATPTGHEPV